MVKKFGGLHFSECTIEFGSGVNKKEVTKLFCWEVLLTKKGELHPEQESKLYAAVMQSNPVFQEVQRIFKMTNI
ncbi:MAG: hypothetical protein U5K72_16005 [Balneolaceae bacterium]|nr:hypothetical protein [Balneolaceae bacterium]